MKWGLAITLQFWQPSLKSHHILTRPCALHTHAQERRKRSSNKMPMPFFPPPISGFIRLDNADRFHSAAVETAASKRGKAVEGKCCVYHSRPGACYARTWIVCFSVHKFTQFIMLVMMVSGLCCQPSKWSVTEGVSEPRARTYCSEIVCTISVFIHLSSSSRYVLYIDLNGRNLSWVKQIFPVIYSICSSILSCEKEKICILFFFISNSEEEERRGSWIKQYLGIPEGPRGRREGGLLWGFNIFRGFCCCMWLLNKYDIIQVISLVSDMWVLN